MKNCFSDPRVKSEGRGCVVTPKMSKSGLDLTDSVMSGKDFFLEVLLPRSLKVVYITPEN